MTRASSPAMRRGLEPGSPRARARDPARATSRPAPTADHQHLRRLPHHAGTPRRGRPHRRDQPGAVASRARRWARRGYVLGDIGPFGGLMEPYGEIPRADVERAFREQARALVEAGADGSSSRRRPPSRSSRSPSPRPARRGRRWSSARSPSTRWSTRTTCAR